ncbi:MAG: cysteine-rich CWC family protein [Acidobacteriota bacterium]
MKIKDALGLISEKYKTASICESCGDEFVCGATIRGCWCTEVKLTDEARADLRSQFKKCLCRDCLEKQSQPSMLIRYPDGSTEFVAGAVRVDAQNFHEGMIDFYDANGGLLKQVDMGSGVSWDAIGEGPSSND